MEKTSQISSQLTALYVLLVSLFYLPCWRYWRLKRKEKKRQSVCNFIVTIWLFSCTGTKNCKKQRSVPSTSLQTESGAAAASQEKLSPILLMSISVSTAPLQKVHWGLSTSPFKSKTMVQTSRPALMWKRVTGHSLWWIRDVLFIVALQRSIAGTETHSVSYHSAFLEALTTYKLVITVPILIRKIYNVFLTKAI